MTDRSIPLNKKCSQCKTDKPFFHFGRDKTKKSGLRSRCKACDRLYEAAQYQAAANNTKTITITEKYCSMCKETKPVFEFYRRRGRPSGYSAKCKKCRNALHATYIKTPMGRWRQTEASNKSYLKYGKAYYQTEKGKEARRRNANKYRASEKGKRKNKDRHMRCAYGITLEQYEAMFVAQNGACAICGDTAPVKGFHLDHCHQTGKVRAILCYRCNSGLGLFLDDPERFRLAMEYLIKHKA